MGASCFVQLSDWSEGKWRRAHQRFPRAWYGRSARCGRFSFSAHSGILHCQLSLHDRRESRRRDPRRYLKQDVMVNKKCLDEEATIVRGYFFIVGVILLFAGCAAQTTDLSSCTDYVLGGFRKIAEERSQRFLGKVHEDTARCRGGEKAVSLWSTPWIDWQNYWAAGDIASKAPGPSGEHVHLSPNGRGIDGALLDLEYQRIELIKFNLFDNNETYEEYIRGRGGVDGPAIKTWDKLRLPKDHQAYASVGGDGSQLCGGELIRFRTLTGICNDIKNPLMGSAGQPFARNVEFDTTFPD